MKRVLVTGGTGCVGRHALPLLVERGWDVHALTSRHETPSIEGVTWHQGNLLATGTAERAVTAIGPDALLHLAWFVAPGKWAAAPANLDWVDASLALVRAVGAAGGRRVVVAGSCLEYDWNYGYCSESRTPCTPHTLYGTCKHALRLLVEGYATQAGVSVAWGRIFFLYGPHEHPDRLIASVARSLLSGNVARCSHGMQVRDYLFAGDVASALVALLERPDVHGPINIGSGRPITLRALAGRVGELLGQPDRVVFGAIDAAATDTPLVVADTTRLSSELGWTPTHDIDEGLSLTIDWWRHELEQEASTRR
jgi:nucleoside-diphosphate-sugar epimerase